MKLRFEVVEFNPGSETYLVAALRPCAPGISDTPPPGMADRFYVFYVEELPIQQMSFFSGAFRMAGPDPTGRVFVSRKLSPDDQSLLQIISDRKGCAEPGRDGQIAKIKEWYTAAKRYAERRETRAAKTQLASDAGAATAAWSEVRAYRNVLVLLDPSLVEGFLGPLGVNA